MTLEQLRIFVAVAERLHMTQAAQALRITQSAASAAIAALEQRYNVRLFNRVGRGLELSEAGRVFLPEAKEVLMRSETASQALNEIAGLKRGSVRIAASQTVANYWLPRHMVRFAQSHPAVDLSLTVGNTQQVAHAVLEGAADIGLIEGRISSPLLRQQIVGKDQLALYAAPDHPLAVATMLSRNDLTQALWIMREPGSGTRDGLEQALAERGISFAQIKILLELPSNEAVVMAVANGQGLTAVSELAAAPHMTAGTLIRLPFEMPQRPFTMILHHERPPGRAVQALSDEWRADTMQTF